MTRLIFPAVLLWLLLAFGGPGHGVAFAQGPDQPTTPTAAQLPLTAPVIVDGRKLFQVRGVSAYPAEYRADRIAERIVAFAADRNQSPKSIQIVETEHSSNIMAGNEPLMGVLDADARIEGVRRQVLARACALRIEQAVAQYREDRTPERLLRNVLLASGAVVGAILLLFLIGRVWSGLTIRIERRYQSAIKELETKSKAIIHAGTIWTAIDFAVRAVSILLAALVIYLSSHLALSLFPWTRGFSKQLFGLTFGPVLRLAEAAVDWFPDLLVIALIVLAVRYLLKFARAVFDQIARGDIVIGGFDREWAQPTYKIVRLLAVAFAVVVCYPYIPGSETAAFKGVTIFLGVLFSLGSSSFIANLIAGYTMTYRRAFRAGDRVRIGDVMGDVTDVRLMVTHIRSVKNEEIVVPNSLVLTSAVTNYSALARERGLILHTTLGIGYETPWRQVEAMLLEAANRTEGLLRQPPPFVLQKSLGDFCVTYEINAYCDAPLAMYQLYTALHRNILDVFNEHAVQIMTPAYRSDPAAPKVVPREHWFDSPARDDDAAGRARPAKSPAGGS